MKFVNIWKICITQGAKRFLMITPGYSKVMHREESSKTRDRQTGGFDVTEQRRFIKMCSVSIWLVIVQKYHLSSFGVISKKDIHNYLFKAIQIFLPFHMRKCVRPEYLPVL